ncbi:RNA-directed DNA polymerase [Flavobacterium gossypii]|uniref:RNA-directed DNA polymerase n=1 Tax=Flavobacterium gossypii TaxID=1646119 RepID=A0ABR6DSR8_9FLAO|nr:reverse transcriptase family protein [Flavobacterium gossypii]MBA9074730.1 RNA-directed DNA polymerase [Flavobacterium gossypii]
MKQLSAILKMSPERIVYILDNIDSFYRQKEEKKFDPKKGSFKTYKNGNLKIRIINPSQGDLKLAQQRAKNRILSKIALPDNVHGGTKKKSNITNAKVHQGNKYIFATDLQEFYPSISSKMVYDAFLKLGYSNHFASHLCKLVTYKHKVPQGAPTSTHISNIVFLQTDRKLIEYCNTYGITYTRYVDDLTFSSQQDFSVHTVELMKIVCDNGYKMSYRKTSYSGEQTITGLIVQLNKIDVPDSIKYRASLEKDDPLQPVTDYMKRVTSTNRHNYRQ